MCDDIHAILQGNWALFEIVCYISPVFDPGGGGNSAYERGGDARRKLWTKPLKESDLGVALAFFWPQKETMSKHRQTRKLGLYEWSK